MKSNPFVSAKNHNPKYFCNRDTEVEFCKTKIEKLESFYIIAKHGSGKTSLIKHVFNEFSTLKKHNLVSFSLLTISSPKQFLIVFLSEIIKTFRNKSKNKREKLNKIVFEKVNLGPDSLFDLSELELRNKLLNVLDFLSTQKKTTIIYIDDFHHFPQITSPLVDEQLFSEILKKNNVQFILSGIDKGVFLERLPVLSLQKIDENVYKRHIVDIFDVVKTSISKKSLTLLFEQSEGDVDVIQSICSKLWQYQIPKIKSAHIKQAIVDIGEEQDSLLQTIRNLLSPYQWRLLVSIATEIVAKQITSTSFMEKYELNAPSSVKTAITALIEKNLIRKQKDGYSLTNIFLSNRISEQHRI